MISFAKPFVPYILLSVLVSLVVSATSCACFFAYIASSLQIKEHPLPSHAISHVYEISKEFDDHSINIEEFDANSNLK